MNIALKNERAAQSQYFQGLSTKRHVMRKMSDRKFMASHAAYEGPFSVTSRINLKSKYLSEQYFCKTPILYFSLISRLISLCHTDLERSRNHIMLVFSLHIA